MKTLPLHFITATLAFGLILSTHAQYAIKQPVAIRAVVGQVSDYRTTAEFNSECTVELKFIGDAAAEASEVLKVQVSRAEDSLNRNLVLNEKGSRFFASSQSERKNGPLSQSVFLRNPSRNATSIKALEGEVELFTPTPANGGLIVLKDFLKSPPAPIQNPTLKKHGIEVLFLTKETFESRKMELSRYTNILGNPRNQWPYSRTAARIYVKDPNRSHQNRGCPEFRRNIVGDPIYFVYR